MRLKYNGELGLGTSLPDAILSLNGQSAQTIDMIRETTAGTSGNNLTIHAGGATSGTLNGNGGNLILSSGLVTGSGGSDITFEVYGNGGSGTGDGIATVAATLTPQGSFGIQTASPDGLLSLGPVQK